MIEIGDFRTKVIDTHNHWGLDKSGESNETTLKEILDVLGNVDQTFLFPSNTPIQGPRGFISNMEVLRLSKESDGRIIPIFRLDLAEIEKCKFQRYLCKDERCCIGEKYGICDLDLNNFLDIVKKNGFKGLKIHMRASMKNYRLIDIDDTVMKRVAYACEDVGLKIVTIHTQNFNMVSQFFKLSKNVLQTTTNTTLICGHAGGGRTKEERRISREFVGRHLKDILNRGDSWTSRMLFDTSNVFWEYILDGLLFCSNKRGIYSKTEETESTINNIIYGTDWPFVKKKTPIEKATNTIEQLIEAGFEEKEIEKIMHKNIEMRI